MKKFFSLMAAALMSVAMMAGENDLLWDFTEGGPTGSPVVMDGNPNAKLYYNNYVNDAAGTNNGLKGIKLNSSGYCAFKKAAVAGKLKLSFGPRSGSNSTCVEVWNATWGEDGKTPAKGETKIAISGNQTEYGTQVIELTAEQNDIYICRGVNVETALQKIQFVEDVARTFVDFKIEFRENPYQVLLPEGGALPEGVSVAGTNYNGGQHGIQGGTITVPVDGPVKFTIGACQYSTTPMVIYKDGVKLQNYGNKAECGETAGNFKQYLIYMYTGEAGTLTFELGSQTYLPYFFAEATDITPCDIIFKDQNGIELGRVETYEGAALDGIPDTIVAKLPAVEDGMAFRGWYYTNGKRAVEGDLINGNTTIQAKVTPIEVATVGSVQVYDFTKETFYPEDHETIEMAGGYYHDGQHGWAFKNNEGFAVNVGGKKAVIVLEVCQYGAEGATWATMFPEVVTPATCEAIGNEGGQMTFRFDDPDGTHTGVIFMLQNAGGENYLHRVTVYNVNDFMEKDANTGYFMVPAGDAASFLMAMVQAESGDKIFLPNGLYDLGETVLTTISKNNIAIIGQSMEGTIIKNAPDFKTESIDKTATLRIAKNVQNTYIQDVTIQNALDYYKNNNGRAVALWDQGTKTICKNVRLLSYQDTYYSNLQGAVKYFRDCEIHGTVDFICGDGSVYFKNTLLYAEKRNKDGGGSDALTANNGPATDKGYVFESCTVKSECPVVSFGRAWNNTPTTTFLNTLVDYSAGEFKFEGSGINRWTEKLMNANAWPKFGEYNTHLADGTVLTPASNEVTFIDEKSGNAKQTIETVLKADEAAAITMEYTLGDWTQTALDDARQVPVEAEASQFEADGLYLVEAEGEFQAIIKGSEFMDRFALYDGVNYTVRKANRRGGFGAVGQQIDPEAIENTSVSNTKVTKIFRDGQVVIVRDGKEYNVLGTAL